MIYGSPTDPFRPCECEQCGKLFVKGLVVDWAYKKVVKKKWTRTLWFCSWSCMRKWEKEHKKK